MSAWQDAVRASIEGRIFDLWVDVAIDKFDDLYGEILAETRKAEHDGPCKANRPEHVGVRIDLWGETLSGDSFKIKIRLTKE